MAFGSYCCIYAVIDSADTDFIFWKSRPRYSELLYFLIKLENAKKKEKKKENAIVSSLKLKTERYFKYYFFFFPQDQKALVQRIPC